MKNKEFYIRIRMTIASIVLFASLMFSIMNIGKAKPLLLIIASLFTIYFAIELYLCKSETKKLQKQKIFEENNTINVKKIKMLLRLLFVLAIYSWSIALSFLSIIPFEVFLFSSVLLLIYVIIESIIDTKQRKQ